MAYKANSLLDLGHAIGGAVRLWAYWSADSIATMTGAGYVTDATNKRMQVGDMIMAFSGTLNTTGPDQSPSTHARGTVSEFAAQPTFAFLQVASIATGAATLTAAAISTDTFVNPTLTGTIKLGSVTTDTVTSTGAVTLGSVTTDTITLTKGTIKVGAVSGDSVGFYGATPGTQPTSANEAAVTTTAAVSVSATQWGFSTSVQATAIITLVNQLRADLVTLGLIKGS